MYEIISNVQYDSNYKAYAHTDASGNIKDYFYRSLFGTSYSSPKLRSIKGLALSRGANMANGIAYATANGSGWHIGSWSQFSLIRTLLVLISKSTDSQTSFGNGNFQGAVYLTTGTLSNAGQFYGYTSENQQVKCFHVEGLWGDSAERLAGHFNSSGNRYVKMTPEGQGYFANAVTGYTNLGAMTVSGQSGVYITNMTCNEYGLFPATSSGGSSSTYFCDMYTYWANSTFTAYQAGGCTTTTAGSTPKGGVFFVSFSIGVSSGHEQIGYSLSYV
ncbi:MAG: hypothetical protein IJS29_04585 [Selenomonadaceae bacterium]|nr:hypothetical protein [Selenomonadaceae bacterium]